MFIINLSNLSYTDNIYRGKNNFKKDKKYTNKYKTVFQPMPYWRLQEKTDCWEA